MSVVESSRRDPVCGMLVDDCTIQAEFGSVHYAFCSAQCRERFVFAPRLYVVRRRAPAPEPTGSALFKQRRIAFATALSVAAFAELRRELTRMMGVNAVYAVEAPADIGIELRRGAGEDAARAIAAAEVHYDLLQATLRQIEQRCAQLGAGPRSHWGDRLQRDFFHYLECCELHELERIESDTCKPLRRTHEFARRDIRRARQRRVMPKRAG